MNIVGRLCRLLATDPTTPRCRSASTIVHRPGEAEEMLFENATARVVDQRGGPSERGRGIVKVFRIPNGEQFVLFAERAFRNTVHRQFVIANENRSAAGACEGGHTIVSARNTKTIGHGFTGSRDHLITKAFRQFEDAIGVSLQRTVTGAHSRCLSWLRLGISAQS